MSFDNLAKDWDNDKNIKRSIAVGEEIKRLLANGKGLSALDFGSGIGLVSFYLKDFFNEILLVDLSPSMIEEADKKIKYNKFDNIETYNGDILNFNEKKKFDVIYCPLVLHHIENYREIIVKLKMLLKDGGKLIIIDMKKDNGAFHKDSLVTPIHHGLDPKTMKTMLEDIGFDCVGDSNEFFEGIKESNGNTAHFKLFSILAAIK